MPQISNTSFSVRFNLVGTPTLVLTDTTTTPPAGLVGIFSITQPDGYTRTGDINNPDIAAAGGTFSYTLRLDSNGDVQRGTYTIAYTVLAPGFISTNFTREFQFTYKPVNLSIREEFDVFTPDLRVIDDTTYSVSNFNNTSVSRSWTAISTPTGTITGSNQTLSLQFGGQFYDANYSITLESSILYTHQTLSWLTVDEVITRVVNTYAQTPPSPQVLVNLIHQLKVKWDETVNACQEQNDLKEQFEFAQALFKHIIDRVLVLDTNGIFEDINDLLRILNNNQIPAYTPTNLPILPYNVNVFAGAIWGEINGLISDQSDLWNILQDLSVKTNYVHEQQVASQTWVVTHNMGKRPSVTIVDTADDEVIGQVKFNSDNQLTIYFSSPISGKAYLN